MKSTCNKELHFCGRFQRKAVVSVCKTPKLECARALLKKVLSGFVSGSQLIVAYCEVDTPEKWWCVPLET